MSSVLKKADKLNLSLSLSKKLIVAYRLCVIYVREDNDFNV